MPTFETAHDIANDFKAKLLRAADHADEIGETPDDEALGITSHNLSSIEIIMMLGEGDTLYLSVAQSGEVTKGRIDTQSIDGAHSATLEGEELERIASLFDTRVHEAADVLRLGKHAVS